MNPRIDFNLLNEEEIADVNVKLKTDLLFDGQEQERVDYG